MSPMSDQKIIAVTGSMGSGKSEFCRLLAGKYPVLDCDAINASLLKEKEKGWQALVQAGIIPAGPLDKKELAARMFSQPALKKQVEQLLHPLIFEELRHQAKAQESNVVFAEVPLLFETGAQASFDEVWCVTCQPQTALERLQNQRGFTRQEAKARLAAQLDPAIKASQSQLVIDNSGSRQELKEKTARILERMEAAW